MLWIEYFSISWFNFVICNITKFRVYKVKLIFIDLMNTVSSIRLAIYVLELTFLKTANNE